MKYKVISQLEKRVFEGTHQRDVPPQLQYRQFKNIPIKNGYLLSIQGSYAHYCTPRTTVSKEQYTEMEMAIMTESNREFVSVWEVCTDNSINNDLEPYFSGEVYGYVPVELLNRLYLHLTQKGKSK